MAVRISGVRFSAEARTTPLVVSATRSATTRPHAAQVTPVHAAATTRDAAAEASTRDMRPEGAQSRVETLPRAASTSAVAALATSRVVAAYARSLGGAAVLGRFVDLRA